MNHPESSAILRTAYHLVVQCHNCKHIDTAVERASKIVVALKTYVNADAITGQQRMLYVAESIEVVLTLYQNQLKHGIEIKRHYEDVPEFFCSPDKLHQVWTHLIHNAIQAMEGTGILEIDVFQENQQIIVQIIDSGCGIPEAVKPHVFEPFFTTKSTGEGSGLG